LEVQHLVFLTDVEGVKDSSGRVIAHLGQRQARILLERGVIADGMIPKVEACLKALGQAARTFIVDGRQPHALLDCLEGKEIGTRVW
jgi:acetylglutamate kinase